MAKNVRITGTRRVKRALRRMRRSARRRAMPRALNQEMEIVVGEAKRKTPVRDGHLRASGHVQKPTVRGGTVQVVGGFGGPAGRGNQGETNEKDVGYALVQHERTDYHHTVGQAKYLEEPFFARKNEIAGNVADELERTLAEESA